MGFNPLTLHQLATRLYLICSLSTDCGKLHTYDVALLRPLGAITTCHSLHLKRTFAVYTHIHTHTHTTVSATEVSLLPVIVCGTPCRHISGRARTTDVIVLLLLLLLHDTLLYTHLTALFLGLPRWAGVRKVKPIWILLKQETVSGSGISWAICKSATRSRQITPPAPHHSVFYRPDALPAAQPTVSKHRRLYYTTHVVIIMTQSQKCCRGTEHSQYKK